MRSSDLLNICILTHFTVIFNVFSLSFIYFYISFIFLLLCHNSTFLFFSHVYLLLSCYSLLTINYIYKKTLTQFNFALMFFNYLKQLPPINSLINEFIGTSFSSIDKNNSKRVINLLASG